ncbi:hypothetical protein AB870_11760 [Pandoraea faecigallinarum]|uniref:Uncharacterized protein n=2 Tax=Pandoraea faecigallinarum TaxID=656179 RepID=A0A0H3WS97_9BURK|nr:hypothetical protein AB870_11760 [Pandoraea faecigallinarum]
MPRRRLNDFLDAIGRRFDLPGLRAQATPGAGVMLENGDAVYFRENGSVDTFDLYFRIGVPPAAQHHPDLIGSITANCFAADAHAPARLVAQAQDCLLFGVTNIEYDGIAEGAQSRLDVGFSEYRTLIEFLRHEVH